MRAGVIPDGPNCDSGPVFGLEQAGTVSGRGVTRSVMGLAARGLRVFHRPRHA
jgi:hypothetical protein